MECKHEALMKWVEEMAKMCQPDKVVWIDGSDRQKRALAAEAVSTGEISELNKEKLPGCYYHRTAQNDVARTEHLTYICTTKKEDAGPNNNWMSPQDGYKRAGDIIRDSMRGRTMYVIPFSMGPVGSPFSKIGVELTDSIYVVLNMLIMTKAGADVLAALGTDGEFTRCLHGKAELDIDKRLILHFPEDNAIWSVGSGYGGNVLLGKKCLALRIASYLAHKENWLAEHMLILAIERPDGRTRHIAAAFPSACGKTNLAMLLPPEHMKKQGYKVFVVGDDIAWMRIGDDGGLWAVNPESGFFGVAPGTNSYTNPNAMKTIERDTIYTNVLLTPDNTVWWEDGEGDPPPSGINWQGLKWRPGMRDEDGNPVYGAHPNSRYTAPIANCPVAAEAVKTGAAVKIDAILFGGRRARLAPLAYQAFDWNHGVFIGASMASERTAAQFGKLGEVRRDPMAMLPFCGYNMADYWAHWLRMGSLMKNPPKIFNVNWFRLDDNGKFIWPGFGENLRVLDWVLKRCDGAIDALETPIGWLPRAGDIDAEGLNLPAGDMEKLLEVPKADWHGEAEAVGKYFEQFGDRTPKALYDQLDALKSRLGK